MAELTRRTVLSGVSALGLGAAPIMEAGGRVELSSELGLDDPERNLTAYVKLRGDLAEEPVYDLVRGDVYGLVSGQAARPLFKLIGAQRSRYKRVSALEFHMETRYVGVLLGWRTEQPLKRWRNPYNERLCEVPVTRYGPSTARLLSDRMAPTGAGPEAPPRAIRPWLVLGGVVHLMDRITAPEAPSMQPDSDLMVFSGNAVELADPLTTRAASRLSFTAVEHWRDWMQMDQPGSLWWHAVGVKLDGPGDYPEDFLAELLTLDPEFHKGDNQ